MLFCVDLFGFMCLVHHRCVRAHFWSIPRGEAWWTRRLWPRHWRRGGYVEPPWTFTRRSPSRKSTHAFKDRKKKKPSPRLTDERFTDREIDGCVWSNKLHTDWETEDLKQLKGETGGNDGRHDELKTPYTLLKGSIRALQVMEFRRWRAHFIPIRGNRIQLKVQVNGWV